MLQISKSHSTLLVAAALGLALASPASAQYYTYVDPNSSYTYGEPGYYYDGYSSYYEPTYHRDYFTPVVRDAAIGGAVGFGASFLAPRHNRHFGRNIGIGAGIGAGVGLLEGWLR